MRRKTRFALLAGGILLGSAALQAPTPVLARSVHLAPNVPSTVVSGTLEGAGTVPFHVPVKEGQKLNIQCHSRKSGIYFFVKDPSGSVVYDSAGSPQPDRWTGEASSAGLYTVGVYQKRSPIHPHKGQTAFFRLHVAVNND
ncbi:hypothetical protein [Acetobacter malorum]|uniref:Uncharacterized protein n=1 Tax=Acetobacter malorum TaxID=178901 RepID=A0A1Y3G999_9PROT|nr:hypothetical protein [Acetobacter malorum]OUJ07871.1 hypothetical protein HK23_01020 [Acetobacter malorum]